MTPLSRIACFQCEETGSSFDHFKNGWRLRSGEFAQLCHRCASVYEVGRFCETFHSNDDGWRDCQSCGKAPKRCLALNSQLLLGSHQDMIRQNMIEPQYWPRVTDAELQEMSTPHPSFS